MKWIGDPQTRREFEVPVRGLAFCCDEAMAFHGWTEQLLEKLLPPDKPPTALALNHAFAELAKRFHTARVVSGIDHRDVLADERDAPCVYGVFIDALERLSYFAITLPPVDREASKPTFVLDGIPLGLLEEREKELSQ